VYDIVIAKDIVQNVFEKVYKHLKTVKDHSKIKACLFWRKNQCRCGSKIKA